MDEKEKEALEKAKKEAQEAIEKMATEKANETAQKLIDEKMAEITSKFDSVTSKEEAEKLKTEFNKSVQELQAKLKELKQTSVSVNKSVSIYDSIQDAIVENAEAIKGFKGNDKLGVTLKAITNASFAGSALENQTSRARRDLYNSPFNPIYLRNIFPNVSTDGASVIIPQISTVTGSVGAWARGTGELGADVEKPEVTPTYKDVTVNIGWIAGHTTVNRELLLNVSYLQGSITNTLLYSRYGIFAQENKMITDYLAANAPAYSGSATIAVEKIIEAAFVQLLGNYYNPTHVLMHPADYAEYIKLNKATGSGEYDLPNDMLRGFNVAGFETNVQIVPVPSLTEGTAYVVAASEFEFINRLAPEMYVSREHDKNLTFNKVTFLVEEMAAFVAKDLNAMVKVTF